MMDSQHFHGEVKQAAGRDILNIEMQEITLWDCDYAGLSDDRKISSAKLFALRCKLLLSWPSLSLISGFLLLISHLHFGLWSIPFFGINLFGPYIAMATIMSATLGFSYLIQRTGKAIAFYKQRIELIDLIIQVKY